MRLSWLPSCPSKATPFIMLTLKLFVFSGYVSSFSLSTYGLWSTLKHCSFISQMEVLYVLTFLVMPLYRWFQFIAFMPAIRLRSFSQVKWLNLYQPKVPTLEFVLVQVGAPKLTYEHFLTLLHSLFVVSQTQRHSVLANTPRFVLEPLITPWYS